MAEEVAKLVSSGRRPPCLAVVIVGDDPASRSYIKGKRRACARVGIESVEHDLPADAAERELLDLIDRLNADDGIDGILVQSPFPDHIAPARVTAAIDPAKDVDGLHPLSQGLLLAGVPSLVPATPLGIIEVLDRYAVPIEGARAVVIGRSILVGKPVALLLLQRNATVTLCHSRTRDLPGLAREADILIAATGRARMVGPDWIKPGAAVIDVGVSVIDGEIVGDVDFDAAQGIAGLLTPCRRGIGPMTITMVLRNTLRAYRSRTGA
ncbi:MAG: bifunctional 5,10-methylenetetrahydrofolate dehydrogenase/5,10-methenyltetrahydrofolate cyclohydrolase [Deltaproteobacteria bacterium]|nr:MAG: bifunctional 5,10-methylenetetrahydrofolate dehydrogenase/5,10-methenyltetrahydrofolate cyclohydrolase [Deltaproteobacteria bacterium]